MYRWVSKTQLAVIAGVSKAAITKASVVAFPSAVDGHRVDLDHVETQIYLQRRGVDVTKVVVPPTKARTNPPAPRPASARSAPSTPSQTTRYEGERAGLAAERARFERTGATGSRDDDEADDDDITAYGGWTLNELLRRFSTAKRFVLWLDARKRMSDIHEKDVKIAERTGRLIPRDYVRTFVFTHLDSLARRFLTDLPTTMVRKIYASARANVPIEEAETMARELMSSELAKTKHEVARALRSAADDADVEAA